MYPPSDQQPSYQTDTAAYYFSHAFDPLNNWSAHAVELWGHIFPTVEHGFHYRKFSETAPAIAQEILQARSPYQALKLAKKYRGKRRTDWEEVKIGLMTELVRAKVAQHEDVRAAFAATKDKQIVENSPDDFWGCDTDGNGQNQMGIILMRVRAEQPHASSN